MDSKIIKILLGASKSKYHLEKTKTKWSTKKTHTCIIKQHTKARKPS